MLVTGCAQATRAAATRTAVAASATGVSTPRPVNGQDTISVRGWEEVDATA